MKSYSTILSVVMLASAVGALAQGTSSPPGSPRWAVFQQFKAAMEGNRVVWEKDRPQFDRITTHTIGGTNCAPVWTQIRVNRDGTSRAAESYTFDWKGVGAIVSGRNSVTFTTEDQGDIGIETPSEEGAKRIASAMEAMRVACNPPGNLQSTDAQAPLLHTWCIISVAGTHAKFTNLFLAEEGKGAQTLSAALSQREAPQAPKEFDCKQFADFVVADLDLRRTAAQLHKMGWTTSALDIATGKSIDF